LLASAPAAWATPIEIVNPSFELTSRPLAVGEQTNGVGGAGVPVATRMPFVGDGAPSWANPVEVPGWRTVVRPAPNTSINRAGVLNPPMISGQPFIQGQDGQNVFAIQNRQVGQVLSVTVQPSTRYRLDFLGGIGRFDSDYFFGVSLIAVDTPDTLPLENEPGVRRLAITQALNHPSNAEGQMLPYFLEFTTPSVLAPEIAGRYLGIHMYGSDGLPRVLYDNFRLEATVVPGPGGFVVVGGALAIGARRRRR
jgi:hypothetical protein